MITLGKFGRLDSILLLRKILTNSISSESLLAWQRVRVANQMAKNGKEWADYSMRENSGTYNNQYMVIDTNLFEYGKPLQGKFEILSMIYSMF